MLHNVRTGGGRLLRKDPAGSTLYLDGMELQATGSAVTATRYYASGGATVALRKTDDAAPTWLLADTQGSAQIAIQGWTGTVARQRYTPYGAHRGGRDDITATEHGFLGHVEDPGTGLDQIGARYYDPATARFISPDPIQNLGDPQARNPYSYAGNNPTTFSDPTGLTRCDVGVCPTPEQSRCAPELGGCTDTDGDGKPNRAGRDGTHPGPNFDGSSGGSSHAAALAAAQAKVNAAKGQIRNAAMGLLRILAEELGITAGLNCFLKGDTGACVETAVNVLQSSVGGLIGKVLAKYGAPWKWAKATRLGKRLWGLANSLFSSVRDFIKAKGALRTLETICPIPNSFVAGTRVRLANGKTKPIEKIKPGDKVVATDPKTGKTRAERVTATIIGVGRKQLVKITIGPRDHHNHPNLITATAGHPFWTPDTQTWTSAAQLHPGNKLLSTSGKTPKILTVRPYTKYQQVYNFAVAHLHTYYVEAGTTPVLVHSCGNATFVADANGTVVPTSASRLESGLQAAVDSGEPGFGTFPTRSAGTGFELPDGSRIRIMEPSANGNAGLRASFTNGADAPVSPFTGKPVQPPRGVNPKQYVRSRTHINLEP